MTDVHCELDGERVLELFECKLEEFGLEAMATGSLLEHESVSAIVTSPPYKAKDGFTGDLMPALGILAAHVLKPGGRIFLNFGQLREDYSRAQSVALNVRSWSKGTLEIGQTIAWVKSIAIDGVQHGHYQPITMRSPTLNYCWEPIYTLFKPPESPIDRLSIGVPFADKSNMKRGTRGAHGDLHCGGDVWFVPYKTTGATEKKQHEHEYPEELVERCLKLCGVKKGDIVLDPFCGSGTTLVVAKRLGCDAVGFEPNYERLTKALTRWSRA